MMMMAQFKKLLIFVVEEPAVKLQWKDGCCPESLASCWIVSFLWKNLLLLTDSLTVSVAIATRQALPFHGLPVCSLANNWIVRVWKNLNGLFGMHGHIEKGSYSIAFPVTAQCSKIIKLSGCCWRTYWSHSLTYEIIATMSKEVIAFLW